MRILPYLSLATSLAFNLALASGCHKQAPSSAAAEQPAAVDPEVSRAARELAGRLSDLINEANTRFRPLDYEYDEDLLKILDRFDSYVSGKTRGPAPRAMPALDEPEEVAHFRETIRRWQLKTQKVLRTEIDALKAEISARKPGSPAFHPEFHKHFAAAFDDLIPIEVAEIRERRNVYLHAKARPLLDEYRAKCPAAVHEHEALLNAPPYNLPSANPSTDVR